MKSKSKWDRPLSGSYDVHIQGQMKHQTSYHNHDVHVPHAESPRDVYNQAKSGLNSNFNITKVIIVFLGIAILASLFIK